MNDLLPLFDDRESDGDASIPLPDLITAAQREALRKAFAQLDVSDARRQFAIVEEMTGQRIGTVQELEAQNAQALIYRLENRVNLIGREVTGNAWDDREEDTWIDKL